MEKITLKNAIEINGKTVTELTHDVNEITGALFASAEAKKNASQGNSFSITPAAEFDFALHLYLGYAAVIAVNSEIDWSDLERVKGSDVSALMKIGRNFMLGTSEKASEEKSSEKLIETSAESIIPASLSSNEEE